MEYRAFPAERVAASDEGVIDGLVTPFGSETVIGDLDHGGFREEVAKGAFTKTLREGDPLMVYQHDMSRPLARKSAGNLELHEGSLDGQEGLVVKATPADTSYARDLRTLIKARVIRGMSFGFNVIKDEWQDKDGKPSNRFEGVKRILREIKLIEVSPVTRPAYTDTAISARDESNALIEERQAHDEDRGPKPYGNVPYADPKNGKYPIDAKHVKAAWSYIHQKKNAAKYPLNGVTLSSVVANIKAAMKKFGHAVASADGREEFVFSNAEWRDDDPYFDEFYEIDDEDEGRDEGSEPETRIKKPSKKRVEQIGVELEQAKKLLKHGNVKDALTLLDSAHEHVGHIKDVEGMRSDGKSAQEPESSTPEVEESDEALRMRMAQVKQRSRELGFI